MNQSQKKIYLRFEFQLKQDDPNGIPLTDIYL